MDAETRKFLEEFRAEINGRLDRIDERLDRAAGERELMWDALARMAFAPGAYMTLQQAATKKQNGSG